MKPKLERQLRQIETDLSNSINQLVKPASEYTIKHMIRDKVLQVHKIGSQYACDFFGVKHFYKAEDFADIGKMSDDVYRTWVHSKRPDSALIAMTSITLAKAVRSKARQINSALRSGAEGANILEVDTNNLAVVMTAAAPRMKQIEQRLPSGIEDLPAPDENVPVIIMIWRTEQDSLVCPICAPLEGQTWELDDPEMLTPVIDTHPNCRCRLELSTEDNTSAQDMAAIALGD
jgi:hypothetical protein